MEVAQAAADVSLDGLATNGSRRAASGAATNVTHGVTNAAPAPATTSGGAYVPGVSPPAGPPPHPPPPPPPPPADVQSCNAFFELVFDLGRTDWSDNEAAVVIFVVIGVTVVLAVVVYAGAFLYEMATGLGDHSYWWDVETQAAWLVGGGDSGYVAGLRLGAGFEDSEARIGLVVEGGYLKAEIRPERDLDRMRVEGGYAMAGASVRWEFGREPANPSFLGLDLLAGTASDDQVDLLSTARANLSFGVGPRARLGVSLGALYVDLDPTEGPAADLDRFTTLMGLQAGYRF